MTADWQRIITTAERNFHRYAREDAGPTPWSRGWQLPKAGTEDTSFWILQVRSPTPIRLLEECVHVLCLVLDNTKQQGRKRLNLNTPFPIWDLCMDCTVIARASGEHCRVRDVQKAHPNCGRPSCNSHLHPYKEWSQASFCLFPRVSLGVCGSTPGCDKHVTSMAIGPAPGLRRARGIRVARAEAPSCASCSQGKRRPFRANNTLRAG